VALRAIHGNRVEALLDALIAALPPADPFEPATIVVGSHLVSRWLVRELAIRRGIAAGIETPTFDRFLEHTWAGDDAARAAGLRALDRRQLAAAIASVLADGRFLQSYRVVGEYMEATPEGGDRAGPRRVQLAEQVATLAWNYALSRPDWMPALLAGRAPADLADDKDARWQAALIGEAVKRACGDAPCAPVPTLPWARRRAGLAPPVLPRPIHVFGVSYLLRAQLEALTDLAATTDVTVLLLDPCAELWDDVSGRGRAAAAADEGAPPSDPLPLTLWGRAVRDTLGALVERTSGDIDDAFVDEPARNVREQLMIDVLHRQATPTVASEESESSAGHASGVTVLACPDPRREIEIVAAEARRALDADPTLNARDIGVWLASNDERYLAQAPAAFEAVGVPWHLIDAPIDDRGRIGEAVLALLELPTSTMTRRDLLRVMTHPAVLAGHPQLDPADWVRWTEKLGIVHGADAKAHAGTYLVDHPGRFHWDQGVRRLALGAFMLGGHETRERGPAKIGDLEVAPEEVRPEKHASAATYALLVRSLCADMAWLSTYEATLADWATVFVQLVDVYLARRDDEGARDLERVRAMLAGIAHVDLDDRMVGFREAREHAVRRLVTARADRGEPLAAGVMIAPLGAARAVPFRIAFVVGLDEGAFPAGDQPSPLDLRREVRPGDVSPRERDRHAFLEVLLGVRDELFLSYVAVEAKSGQALGPSSVVLELADALAPYLGAASSKLALERLSVRHPLHRGSGERAAPPAIARERWAIRVRDALRTHLRAAGHPVPDEDGMFALLAHPALASLRGALGIVDAPRAPAPTSPSRPLTIGNLRGFLEAPVQAWAQSVLGLDELPDDEAQEHSDEPFHVDRPARALLLREVLAAQLREGVDEAAERPMLRLVTTDQPPLPTSSRAERAEQVYLSVVRDMELRGQFPVGVFGEAARAADLRLLELWRTKLGTIDAKAVTRIAFGRSTSPAAELRSALDIPLPGGRTVRLVGQTELLVCEDTSMSSAAGALKYRSIIPLIGEASKRSRYHLRGALDHLVLAAAGIATAGHSHVLVDRYGGVRVVDHTPWAQDEAIAHLATLIGELLDDAHGYLLPFDHLISALSGKPPGRSYGETVPVLGYGPINRLDGLAAPLDPGPMARRRLGPIVSRMRGDHSLGGTE